MNFTWGGLAPLASGFAEEPPAGAVTDTSSVEVVEIQKTDIGPHVDGAPATFATLMTERFTGGLDGMGYADHVRVVRPDGTQLVTGVERFVGSVGDRSGSFVLTCYGFGDRPGAGEGYWTVVPGSGTGELTGLRGRGSFTIELRDGVWHAKDTFTHWFVASPEGEQA
ncbi:DUF3224 domain-containing protein [Saccharomonospora sp. NPDC046836]|uniref:DUF3224 domain-containing protein n=1 Tax=Saccharomonospora sp. NPDC046836 TaxID=3156921 RepID=UPI0033D516E2